MSNRSLKSGKSKKGIAPGVSGKKSRRIKYVRTEIIPIEEAIDSTLKGEERFLKKIELFKERRLEQQCYCKVTSSLLMKERMDKWKHSMKRVGRFTNILCCPPCCLLLPRIAFWPPLMAYFFYELPEMKPSKDEPIEKLKQTYKWIKKAGKSHLGKEYCIGMRHECSESVEDVTGFVLETRRKNYIACVHVASKSTPRYYMLYSHPNGSDLSDHLTGVPCLQDMARFYRSDVYAYDYSGYGISSGHASEANQNADIEAIYQYMIVEKKIHPNKIVLVGYSIGTSASVNLITTIQEQVAGVILLAPPMSIMRVLPTVFGCEADYDQKTCCADRFCTYDKVGNVSVPLLVIHGINDARVPVGQGQMINEKAPNKVNPLWVEANHDNLENCREVWTRIRTFLRKEVKKDIQPPPPPK